MGWVRLNPNSKNLYHKREFKITTNIIWKGRIIESFAQICCKWLIRLDDSMTRSQTRTRLTMGAGAGKWRNIARIVERWGFTSGLNAKDTKFWKQKILPLLEKLCRELKTAPVKIYKPSNRKLCKITNNFMEESTLCILILKRCD